MNSEVQQNTRAQSGEMLGIQTASAKMIIISFRMIEGYLNTRPRNRD